MYQSRFGAMTASLFFTPHASATDAQPSLARHTLDRYSLAQPSVVQPRGVRRPLEGPRRSMRRAFPAVASCSSVLGMALVLMLVAAVVAPEQPVRQGDICERHNGPAACRVW